MNSFTEDILRVAFIGVGATAVMDLWLLLLKLIGVPTLDFAALGRWVGHGLKGHWMHAAIAKAAPISGERALGWLAHYGIGIAFAGLLVAIAGMAWTRSPRLGPALALGIGTVVVPLFVMQPAMGAGIAGAKTPTPWKNRARSVLNHTVFGTGLYVAAVAIEWIVR